MERRFNGRHGLLIDLARIVSAFFSFIFFLPGLFFHFLFCQLPLTSGSLFTMSQRRGISVGRLECTGRMVPKKEHCFILNDDGLRLHCDKTKKHHHTQTTLS